MIFILIWSCIDKDSLFLYSWRLESNTTTARILLLKTDIYVKQNHRKYILKTEGNINTTFTSITFRINNLFRYQYLLYPEEYYWSQKHVLFKRSYVRTFYLLNDAVYYRVQKPIYSHLSLFSANLFFTLTHIFHYPFLFLTLGWFMNFFSL